MEGVPPEAVLDGTFFDRLGLLMGAEAVDAFKRLRVAVFGVGGVGGWCAESLVRSGVGHLMIVDSDRVCATNVNRQVMATSRTVGQMKVAALRERLLEINPAAEVVAEARVYSAETAATFDLGSFDYVVDAIDSMRAKAHLINAVTRMERPTLVSSLGAARKTDPFRIRQSEFWKVKGDATSCPRPSARGVPSAAPSTSRPCSASRSPASCCVPLAGLASARGIW